MYYVINRKVKYQTVVTSDAAVLPPPLTTTAPIKPFTSFWWIAYILVGIGIILSTILGLYYLDTAASSSSSSFIQHSSSTGVVIIEEDPLLTNFDVTMLLVFNNSFNSIQQNQTEFTQELTTTLNNITNTTDRIIITGLESGSIKVSIVIKALNHTLPTPLQIARQLVNLQIFTFTLLQQSRFSIDPFTYSNPTIFPATLTHICGETALDYFSLCATPVCNVTCNSLHSKCIWKYDQQTNTYPFSCNCTDPVHWRGDSCNDRNSTSFRF
jgi:hypothetical protein